MGDRIDEAKGNIKEAVGKVTGNERLEAEGEAEHDTARAAREAKGVGNQIKGSVKETRRPTSPATKKPKPAA